MKKNSGFVCSGLCLLLVLSGALIVQPTRANAGAADSPATQVKIDNFTFGPATVTVPLNSTVIWVNKDDIPHIVASTDGVFKSKALDTDQTFSFTFTKSGTYEYFCSIHPKMVGKIVVQ